MMPILNIMICSNATLIVENVSFAEKLQYSFWCEKFVFS